MLDEEYNLDSYFRNIIVHFHVKNVNSKGNVCVKMITFLSKMNIIMNVYGNQASRPSA